MTLLGCLEYPGIIGYDTHAPVIPVSHGTRESGAGKVSSHKRRRTRCSRVGGGVFDSQAVGSILNMLALASSSKRPDRLSKARM